MTPLTGAAVRAHVTRAATALSPLWPLTSFIAVNPLAGHEERPFDQLNALTGMIATRREADYRREYQTGAITEDSLREAVRCEVPELSALRTPSATGAPTGLDLAVAALLHAPIDDAAPPPEREPSDADRYLCDLLSRLLGDPIYQPTRSGGLYTRYRSLAAQDRALPRAARRRLAALPEDPAVAIGESVRALGWDDGALERHLTAELQQLPGWASHLAWRATHTGDATLTDYLAIRLTLHRALGEFGSDPGAGGQTPASAEARNPATAEWAARVAEHCIPHPDADIVRLVLAFLTPARRRLIWQVALEAGYRTDLMARLDVPTSQAEPDAQLLFCIDVRSEGLRRHLETSPRVHTLGIAGFFGIPLSYRAPGGSSAREQYPALLSAGVAVTEQFLDPLAGARHLEQEKARAGAAHARETTAGAPLAMFTWAEVTGWLAGFGALSRTLLRPRRSNRPTAASTVDICARMTVEDQAAYAEASLRMVGLTAFAPVVVLVGHKATTQNNLYQAALDCGACGGNPGGVNARAAAAIFNNTDVRSLLARRGVSIDAGTVFIAAEHDTTTDALTILDQHLIPDSHRRRVDELQAHATVAADALTRERAADVPGARPSASPRRLRDRAADWAEMYPELGLANNAALIIAPRSVTRGADLRRRVFLHDYDPAADLDGSGLVNIMTAPLIVAHWINAQYYFSTVDPDRHGAGNKTLHNPIGDLGVMSGHSGDLRTGLPWQSVATAYGLLHTPLRLSVFVQAPLEQVAAIIAATDSLRRLLDGGWISLHARALSDAAWQRYGTYGFTPDERTHS